MIINSYVFGGFDADAQAFITAAGITDNTQKSAINTLVVSMKGYGIWTKMKAIYPFVGGTASTHKWNLKNPLDTNAAFRLVFSGGWTHSSTGAKPNGLNAIADTFLISSGTLSQNSSHISYYSRTNSNLTEVEIGTASGNSPGDAGSLLEIRTSGISYYRVNSDGTYITYIDADSRAFYVANRTGASVINGWRNSTKVATGITASTGLSTKSLILGAYNAGSIQFYSTKECAFSSIGDGLTDTDAANFYTAVQAFNTTLGRSVGPQTVSDPDAQAFVNAAVIDDQVQAQAVNTLTIDLKAANIWTKMKAIYPFVGGTATTHKWNLKDPRDLDAAYRLVFNGGWTHSNSGALPNGVNGYADTFFNALTNMSIIDVSFGSYVAGTASTNRSHIGYINSTNQQFYLNTQTTTEKRGLTASSVSAGYYMSKTGLTATTQRGFWAASNRSATDRAMICSDASFVYSTLSFSAVQGSFNLYIGARNASGAAASFDTMEHRFDFIGTALNDAELTSLRTIVTTFETSLGRQV